MTAVRARLSIAAQIEKFDRIAADRRALYRRTAKTQPQRATMLVEKDLELADVRASLEFLARWQAEIKAALPGWVSARRQRVFTDAALHDLDEVDDLRSHPAVDAVLAAFPGATISSVRPLANPAVAGGAASADLGGTVESDAAQPDNTATPGGAA